VKVAFCTPDFANKLPGQRSSGIGGAGYYRCQLPADMLNKYSADIHAEVFPGCWSHPQTGELYPVLHPDRFNPDRLICDETGWDVIVLQRWMAEKDRQRILRARAHGQTILQDVDDHFWSIDKANRAYKDVRREDWNADFYRANLAASDHITVSTPYLAEHLADLGVPLTVLPNMIDLEQWTRQPVKEHVQTVGWCGHTGYRSGDLETLGNSMRYFLRDHPDITFLHGGHDPSSTPIWEMLRIPKNRVATRLACPITQWPRIWHGIDIAVLPLNDVDFNLAKSDIKRKEASAAGVPTICTKFGPYDDDWPTWHATDPSTWREALEDFLRADLRQRWADRAYQRVQAEDANQRWTDWANLYRNLTGQRSAA